ncbi:MAG: tRNA (guanosine(46)-N7)-methyltransferase TrmB [Clostridiales bacterium]|nr:tRNA (guanosine(46)-N7)-methyltransferase TrmB [Clostridiales bacterium]
MRMRRKKHLKERIDNIKDFFLVIQRDITNVNEAIKDKKIIDFEKEFGNSNPVEVDVGCGKGGFITELAIKNPDKNYIGVEMMENIFLLAAEKAQKLNLKNVKFMNTGAEYLPRYFDKGSIKSVYLNFSPPYPPKSYSNRRLSNPRFLQVYDYILEDTGRIFQKTDDKDFYQYSFETMLTYGLKVEDLYESCDYGFYKEIITEYESKFRLLDMPIYGLVAKK